MAERLVDTRTMKSGEAITYEIAWWSYLTRYWSPGERFETGVFIQPTRPTGRQLECTTAGQTGAVEPKPWPFTVGDVRADGSVVWTVREIGNDSVDTIATSAWATTLGLTIASQQTDTVKQLTSARLSGGIIGQTYRVTNEIATATGDEYIFTLLLTVDL